MTTKDKVARRKLSLLELAAEMSNVSKACRIMGYSRQQFYEIVARRPTLTPLCPVKSTCYHADRCPMCGLNNRRVSVLISTVLFVLLHNTNLAQFT